VAIARKVATALVAASAMIATGAVPAASASTPAVRYGYQGWAGYSWSSSSSAAATFKVPALSGPDGAEAFWVGLGKGDPGIQQCGITATVSHGKPSYQAWYEMWPAIPYSFGGRVSAGNVMRFTVTRSGAIYTLTVQNLTLRWTARVSQRYSAHESSAEAIAEAFGPRPSGFTPAHFSATSDAIARWWAWPFGGERATADSAHAFTVSR
jgi:hypothetical protein